MEKIAHRINTLEQLDKLPREYGAEIDLRPTRDDLILHHDPFCEGVRFEDFLKKYHHGTLILNIKSEGIEQRCFELLAKYKIERFFLLDVSLPFFIKLARNGQRNMAMRFSEFEPLEFCLKFKNMVDWLWIDCVSDLPLSQDNYGQLAEHFKLCLVSPELWGRDVNLIQDYQKKLHLLGAEVDAVCTKRPDLWP